MEALYVYFWYIYSIVARDMTKQNYIRQVLVKLQDVWSGATWLLYFLDSQQLNSATVDTLCVLLQEAINPVYQQDAQVKHEIHATIQKLQKLKEHMDEEEKDVMFDDTIH